MSSASSPVVWITGASRGIGAAVAKAFASAGARVAVSGRNASAVRHVAEEIRSRGGVALPFICDVRSASSVQRAHKAIVGSLGEVQVLVNNAAITFFKSFILTTAHEFDGLVETNLRGPFLCIQKVLPGMLKRKRGTIVNIVSVSATTTFRDSSAYSASKAGLLAMSRGLRAEVRNAGVRVIDLLPGAVDTAMWPQRIRRKHGKRMMTPDEVAAALVSVYSLPDTVVAEEIVLRPRLGDL